jgi:antitoxin component YwqK of YwqJK toxin-antitoxin module
MRFLSLVILITLNMALFAQSDTIFNQKDVANRKQGYWKKSWPTGKLMYKGYFRDNKPVGEMRRYFESGALKAILIYDKNSVYAKAKIYYEDGTLAAQGNYFNAEKDSVWTYYSYYNKSLSARESYVKGSREGSFINYYPNGEISEKTEYKNNMKNGNWEQYFKGNVPKLMAHYENNKLEGGFIVYFNTGKPYITGQYKNSLREGKWMFYKEDGTVENVLNYNEGKAAEEKQLNKEEQDFFKLIDESQGKFNEPDETEFLQPNKK